MRKPLIGAVLDSVTWSRQGTGEGLSSRKGECNIEPHGTPRRRHDDLLPLNLRCRPAFQNDHLSGAVSARRGSGALRDQVVHVRLIAPEMLCGLLGRVPAPLADQDAGPR